MKKFFFMICILCLTVCCTGCSGRIVASEKPSASSAPLESSSLKTGLSVMARVSESTSASNEQDGIAKTTIDLVALTIDNSGVIRSCEIDSVDTFIQFDSSGRLLTDPSDIIYTKDELGEDYGMHTASSIGKEWDEQAEAMADYAVGKTVAQLNGIAVDEKGKPTDADLSASVTISIGGFLAGINAAADSALPLGAKESDDLELVCITDISGSSSASGSSDGVAATVSNIAAVSFDDEIITSCIFDGVQANIRFDASGNLTDVPESIPTKNQLGRDYGMHTASTIDKDWNEQAQAFAKHIIGRTSAEVGRISVNEKGSPTDPDLTSSVTLSVSDFQALIAKAEEE